MLAGIPRWEVITAWALRVTVVITGVAFLIKQDWAFGVFCFIGVAIVVTPTFVSRTTRFIWPIEIELMLLIFIAAHASLGYLLGLYNRLDIFDKLVHFTDSLLIGFLAFLAVYVAHYLRRDREHRWIDSIAILLITLGFGALWEIVEFSADQWFGTHMQASQGMTPLTDTMLDLIVDGAGGVLAGVLGPIYMRHSRRSRERVHTFAERLEHRPA